MKRIFLTVLFTIIGLASLQAQSVNFGLTGGFFLGSANTEIGGINTGAISNSLKINDGAGFYVGLLADLGITDKFHVQPEAVYAHVNGEGAIVIPVMAKYYIADGFNIQAGPQIDFFLNIPTAIDQVIKKIGFSLAFGAGYDINDKFAIQAKYSVGLNNRVESAISNLFGGALANISPSLKTNALLIGVVYKFN